MTKIFDRVKDSSKVVGDFLSAYPPLPKSVKIEVTSRCDLKCFFCSVTYKKHPSGDIEPSFMYKLLDELGDIGVKEIGLFWLGEPLLVKELPEYISYAKKAGIEYIFLTTNGRLATPERIKPLFDSGLNSIKVSINASNREQYEKVCGVDAYDQVISNIKSLKSIRGDAQIPAIYASTVFDPNSRKTFDDLAGKIGPYVDEHYPLRLYGTFTYEEKIDGFNLDNEFRIEPRSLEEMMPCWSIFKLPHISFDGHLSACYCDHDSRLYMADLNKMSFKEAWHSSQIVNLRQRHLDKVLTGHTCEKCIAYTKE